MGLNKKLHTKLCEGSALSMAEKRFGGIEPWPTKRPRKRKSPKKEKNNGEFVTDMLKDLL